MKKLLLLAASIFFLSSCGGGSNSTGCRMGVPEAMFSSNLSGISDHSFRVTNNNSTEEFKYNGDPVVVYQTGCHFIEQEYHFTFKEKTDADSEGMIKIADILTSWSKLGPEQGNFAAWADQIRIVSNEMQMGDTYSPSKDITIGLSRVNTAEGEIIILSFEQKS